VLSAKDGEIEWRRGLPYGPSFPIAGTLPIRGGLYWVEVTFDRFAPIRMRVAFSPGAVFEVVAPPSCGVTVQIKPPNGIETRAIYVTAKLSGSPDAVQIRSKQTDTLWTIPQGSGHITPLMHEIVGLAPGLYDIVASAETSDHWRYTLFAIARDVEVSAEGRANVTLALVESPAVHVIVRRANGDRADDVVVIAHMTALNGRAMCVRNMVSGTTGYGVQPGETVMFLPAGGIYTFEVGVRDRRGTDVTPLAVAPDCDVSAVSVGADGNTTVEVRLAE
jgi:hypothetical protein